jgi:tetratricopeptide (TPR) repeat protein
MSTMSKTSVRKKTSYDIFISYRRHDTKYHTKPIFDALEKVFGKEHVFLDIESIQFGEKFREKILDALHESKVLIALIEKEWVATQDQDGQLRLFSADDFVRLEIETALSQEIPIIPVLFDQVPMPKKEDLPDTLKSFTDYNAIEISSTRIAYDIQRLTDAISIHLDKDDTPIEQEPEEKQIITKIKDQLFGSYARLLVSLVIMVMIIIAIVYIKIPSGHQDYLTKGNQYLNTGYYQKAAEQFKAIITHDPTHQGANIGLRKIAIHQMIMDSKSTDIIEKEIQMLKEKNSDDPHIDLFRAELFASTDQAQAISLYQQVIQNHPHLAEAYFALGVIYQKKKDSQNALLMYQKALEIAPLNIRYLTNKGDLLFRSQQYDECVTTFQNILKLDQHVLLTYCDLIHALRMKGNMKKAAHYADQLEKLLRDQAIFHYPPNADVWFFTIQDHSLSLRDWHSKRSYLYFTISLTDMLSTPEKKIAPTIQKACKALMQSEMNHDLLKKLVLFQARQIYDAHVAYRQHIRTFWNDVSCKNK